MSPKAFFPDGTLYSIFALVNVVKCHLGCRPSLSMPGSHWQIAKLRSDKEGKWVNGSNLTHCPPAYKDPLSLKVFK